MSAKNCFFNSERTCDLTCKAAFEVDDPVDNVDCYFIWLAYHFGEGLYEVKRVLEGFAGGPGGPAGASPGGGSMPGGGPSGPPPKPKGSPQDN